MPVLLFVLTVGGLALAACYHLYCLFFGARLLVRCPVPGDAVFEVAPDTCPVRLSVRVAAGPPGARPPRLQFELEREGSWQWTRVIDLGSEADRPHMERFVLERPGQYRLKARQPQGRCGRPQPVAAVSVHRELHVPRRSVYLLAGGMLAGGLVSLMLLLA
jgi:hypothetical protein